jgi:hypothetical protein
MGAKTKDLASITQCYRYIKRTEYQMRMLFGCINRCSQFHSCMKENRFGLAIFASVVSSRRGSLIVTFLGDERFCKPQTRYFSFATSSSRPSS